MAVHPGRTTDLREVNLRRKMSEGDPSTANAPEGPGPITDPNALPSTITPENTIRNQRLGFGVEAGQVAAPTAPQDVQARDTVSAVAQQFQSQLPQFQQQLQDEIEGLSKRTAAMGRTGSGMFNRERGLTVARNQAAREALLGNLVGQATQADANRALQAAQGNQSSGLAFENLAANIAQSNVGRNLDVDFARQAHLNNLQAREDALARQAMQDEGLRLSLLQQGFGGTPTAALGQAADIGLAAGEQFGANAGQLNTQLGGLSQEVIEALIRQAQGGGASAPALPQGTMVNNPVGGVNA